MRTAAALALCLAFTQLTRADEPVSLKWTLKEGDVFYAKNVADQDMQMEFMGNKIPVKMKVTMVQKFAIRAVKPGATTVEMTITDMSMDLGGGGLPGGAGLGGIGEQIKGTTLTATFDDKFEVTKVTGTDKLLDKFAQGDPTAMFQAVRVVGQLKAEILEYRPQPKS